jgi:hypothetical protein
VNGDCWDAFLLRNGFARPEIGQVDKTVVTKTLVRLVVPPPTLFPSLEHSTYPNPTKTDTRPDSCLKDGGKPVKRSGRKKGKGNNDINYKSRKVACWVSRCAHNKPK